MIGACRVLGALVFSFILTGAASPPPDSGPPSAADISAKVDAARGTPPDVFHETDETVSSNGTTTVEHDFTSGKDYRYVIDKGALHTERGSYHGTSWHMDANGQVVVAPPDDTVPNDDLPPSVVTPIQTPVDGYLVSSLSKAGYGMKEYVDRMNWRVIRREIVGSDGTITTTYEDFRTEAGRAFPHHIRTDDAPDGLVTDWRMVSYGTGDVTDADLAIPNPRRALVTFPPNVTSVELPARFDGTRIFVRVKIGDRGLDYQLDSGASGITIDAGVAKELGLHVIDQKSMVTARKHEVADAIVPEMTVGSLTMRNVAVKVLPEGWDMSPSIKSVGLLGFDFLAELGVTIDYEHQRVTAVPGSLFEPPSDPGTVPVAVRIDRGVPEADVTINGVLAKHFILDTGADGTFTITDYFARHHPDAFKFQTSTHDPQVFRGIGGAFLVERYSMSSVRLASIDFHDFYGFRIVTPGVFEASHDDGLIGAGFLQLFTLKLDYGKSLVYLVPRPAMRRAMRREAHG